MATMNMPMKAIHSNKEKKIAVISHRPIKSCLGADPDERKSVDELLSHP